MSDRQEHTLTLPPAPQLPRYPNRCEQAYESDVHYDDSRAYARHSVADAERQKAAPRRNDRGVTSLVTVVVLTLMGGVGVFAYHSIVRHPFPPTSTQVPNNSPAASSEPQARYGGNERQIDATETGSIIKSVRAEPPKSMPRVMSTIPTAMPRDSSSPIGKRKDFALTAVDQEGTGEALVADPSRTSRMGAAAAHSEALAAVSLAPGDVKSAAAGAPPALGGGYAVQVTAERSESRAQAAFRALQLKYPNQLNGRPVMIRRADLGAAGIYYRAFVAPFASAEKAAKFCRAFKAAGGDCVIQRN